MGTIYITAFTGCTYRDCVPSCSLVRVSSNGTTDVLHQASVDLHRGENCQGPSIGSDGTVYALIGRLMTWNSQGKSKWVYSAPRSAIHAFVLGANDTALVQTAYVWQPPNSLALYGVDKSGNVKWTHKISDDEAWNPLAISEDGAFQFIVSNRQGFGGSLVRVDGNGQVGSNSTIQGSASLSLQGSTMAADGTMALLACVGDTVVGHRLLYVLPKDGKHGWSFAPPGDTKCDTGTNKFNPPKPPLSVAAFGIDGGVYMTAGDRWFTLYKLTKPAVSNVGLVIV